jgi:hypothetical protein
MKRRTFIAVAVGGGLSFTRVFAFAARADLVVVDSAVDASRGFLLHAARMRLPVFDVQRFAGGDIAMLWYEALRFAARGEPQRLVGVTRASDFFVLQRLAMLSVFNAEAFDSAAVAFSFEI